MPQPMPGLDELPDEVRACLPGAPTVTVPPQGEMSLAYVVYGEPQPVVVKTSRDLLGRDALEREAKVLEALAPTDLGTPRVVTLHVAADKAWLVTTFLPGQPLWHVLRDSPSLPHRRERFEELGRFLARVHCTPVPAELERVAATPWLDAQRRRRARQAPVEPDAWLEERRASAHSAAPVRCLVHGDFTLDNVIVDEDGITGAIDWAAAGRGDPGYDIALALLPARGVELSSTDVAAFLAGYGDSDLTKPLRDHFDALYG
jgi:aminoglycoside 3'-phosphotransferase-2